VLTTDSNQTFGQRLTQALQQQADETFNCSLLDSLQE
jgi:hypothetical protein